MLLLGLVILILVLLLLRQNLLVILALATAYSYWFWGDGLVEYIVLDGWYAVNKEVLLSIPLYLLAGTLMSQGSMADRIIALLKATTIAIPGGLALAAVLSCAMFAAISGSSTVTLLAIGTVLYPALLKAGYSKYLSMGVLCAAGTLGIIVPPSIPLILYGVMTNTSITDLFKAGIGPALVIASILSIYVILMGRQSKRGKFSFSEVLSTGKSSVLAVFMPLIVLGGIYSGFFTATEAAAVAVVYTLVVQMGVYREMDFDGVLQSVEKTAALIGSLFPVLMIALSLNQLLNLNHVPPILVEWMTDSFQTKTGFLVAVNFALLAVGSIMDIGSAILVLAPLLKPIAAGYGIDQVHFGIMMIVNLEIGYLTPPMGLNIIVAMSVFRESFIDIIKAVIPFIGLLIIGLVIVTLFPQLSLFLL